VDSLIVGVGTLEVVAVVGGLTSVFGVFKISKKFSFGAFPLQQKTLRVLYSQILSRKNENLLFQL
jgi:hypothetical protein